MAGVPETADAVCWLVWGEIAMDVESYMQEIAHKEAQRQQSRMSGRRR